MRRIFLTILVFLENCPLWFDQSAQRLGLTVMGYMNRDGVISSYGKYTPVGGPKGMEYTLSGLCTSMQPCVHMYSLRYLSSVPKHGIC